jgi:hypothetical protein
MTAQRGSRGAALPFLNLGARWMWMPNSMPWPFYPQTRDPVPLLKEAGCVPRPAWTGAENLPPTGIRSPDRPNRSELLYRLSYPGPLI